MGKSDAWKPVINGAQDTEQTGKVMALLLPLKTYHLQAQFSPCGFYIACIQHLLENINKNWTMDNYMLHHLNWWGIYQWRYENIAFVLLIARHKSLTLRWTTCCLSFLLQEHALNLEIWPICARNLLSLSQSPQPPPAQSLQKCNRFKISLMFLLSLLFLSIQLNTLVKNFSWLWTAWKTQRSIFPQWFCSLLKAT